MSDLVLGLPVDTTGLEDSDIVTDVIIVAKVISTEEDCRPSVCVFTSGGLDWITQTGLLQIARHVVADQELDDDD